MKVFLGSDHRGFELKKVIAEWLRHRNIEHYDLGADSLNPGDDYNDYAIMVSKEVLKNPGSFGVLLCGSAQGMAMQANRFKGIRAALCHTVEEVRVTREHNNANIICIPTDDEAAGCTSDPNDMLDTFLKTSFLEYDRYLRRNQKLDEDYN